MINNINIDIMSKIKNLKPSSTSKYNQGYFNPTNTEKYKGDLSKIIYRSSWEKKFCGWCDLHPNIISWSSEPVAIPFLDPCAKLVNGVYQSAMHNYYVDFFVTIQKENIQESWLIEIKPGMQVPTSEQILRVSKMLNEEKNKTDKKIRRYNNELKTLLVNRAKFLAAKKFAEQRGCKFAICDENFLF